MPTTRRAREPKPSCRLFSGGLRGSQGGFSGGSQKVPRWVLRGFSGGSKAAPRGFPGNSQRVPRAFPEGLVGGARMFLVEALLCLVVKGHRQFSYLIAGGSKRTRTLVFAKHDSS